MKRKNYDEKRVYHERELTTGCDFGLGANASSQAENGLRRSVRGIGRSTKNIPWRDWRESLAESVRRTPDSLRPKPAAMWWVSAARPGWTAPDAPGYRRAMPVTATIMNSATGEPIQKMTFGRMPKPWASFTLETGELVTADRIDVGKPAPGKVIAPVSVWVTPKA